MRNRALIGLAIALSFSLIIHAEDLTAPAQSPAPVNSLEVDGGYAFELGKGSDTSYYQVVYNGNSLATSGTPIKFASSLDLAAPAMTATGDRPELAVKLEHGLATLGGTLFEANGARPLQLNGIEKLNLRGTALITGKLSGGPISFAGGLETPPFHIPQLGAMQYSNWLVFGVNAEHQEQTDTNADKNFGLATYRAFVGKAFGWHKSADVGKTAKALEKVYLDQAPTFAEAKAVVDKIMAIPANKRSAAQQGFVDTFHEASSDADWKQKVHDAAAGIADAVTDQQTFSFYAESSGWYGFKGADRNKLKNLFTATFDYWPLKGRDDTIFRVRYENGFERATPNERKNHILASAAIRF